VQCGIQQPGVGRGAGLRAALQACRGLALSHEESEMLHTDWLV
jgi:hypothetical protein